MADPGLPGIGGPGSVLANIAVFGGYAVDTVDHALGGDSNYAAQLEQQADPSLNSVSSASPDAAQSVLDETTQAENQTLAEQSAQAKSIATAAAANATTVLVWLLGLGLIVGAIVLMGELSPLLALLGRGKK